MDDLGVPPMLGNLRIWWVVSNTFIFNDHDPNWLLQYVEGGNHELAFGKPNVIVTIHQQRFVELGISKIGMMFIMTPQSWLVTAMVTMA